MFILSLRQLLDLNLPVCDQLGLLIPGLGELADLGLPLCSQLNLKITGNYQFSLLLFQYGFLLTELIQLSLQLCDQLDLLVTGGHQFGFFPGHLVELILPFHGPLGLFIPGCCQLGFLLFEYGFFLSKLIQFGLPLHVTLNPGITSSNQFLLLSL